MIEIGHLRRATQGYFEIQEKEGNLQSFIDEPRERPSIPNIRPLVRTESIAGDYKGSQVRAKSM